MGLLVDGEWRDQWYDTKSTGGRFQRSESRFREWISADGSSGFKAESGRYHLYVSLACPWAHRTLIARQLKGLADHISVSVVNPLMREHGWTFEPDDGVIPDTVHGARYLYEVYQKADPSYTGRVTTPTLWDRERETIVSNESADILRMLDSEFVGVGASGPVLYPSELRKEIDEVNELVYHRVNNGVYKAGFATSQEAYDEAVTDLFAALDALEARLARQPFLAGEVVTEADWRLWTTLIRFDPVYHGHFKCNRRRLVDYRNLWDLTRALYQVPGIAETVNMDHITRHYYQSHRQINPTGIVPIGPELDLTAPAQRPVRFVE